MKGPDTSQVEYDASSHLRRDVAVNGVGVRVVRQVQEQAGRLLDERRPEGDRARSKDERSISIARRVLVRRVHELSRARGHTVGV